MADSTVTAEQLAFFLKTRKNGAKIMSVMGKFGPFIDAMNTEVGREILQDAVANYDFLLSKIANLEATPEETMEYKAFLKIIRMWSERIARYEKALDELTGGINERTI